MKSSESISPITTKFNDLLNEAELAEPWLSFTAKYRKHNQNRNSASRRLILYYISMRSLTFVYLHAWARALGSTAVKRVIPEHSEKQRARPSSADLKAPPLSHLTLKRCDSHEGSMWSKVFRVSGQISSTIYAPQQRQSSTCLLTSAKEVCYNTPKSFRISSWMSDVASSPSVPPSSVWQLEVSISSSLLRTA